ncbi:electron transport complex subunit RsxG [Permianibacter sp. IMCC34836]|uniref:electron transport complex subunit RsxG n=1 Tax=Permianibacter fluminis TaxID=2738515 RepID=UPI001554503D|nr:electron transport complex subunit RsxG [Permianibacter fluminis]NQD37217.1 electron transport complex subunit RsxG [Permianibacter fluminis]
MSMGRHALILGAFTLICTGAIVAVDILTRPRIEAEQDAAFARLLGEVLPMTAYDNNIAQDCVAVLDTDVFGREAAVPVYRARRTGAPVALVFTATAPDGYSGNIDLLIAIYHDGKIAGTRVTAHKETPGLGDKIERRKSDWMDQFRGRSLQQPSADKWTVRKDGGDFDGFTGATITPRAVLHALQRVQLYHANHRDELFSAASNCHASAEAATK